jgi:CheY-like chemotaxis protein
MMGGKIWFESEAGKGSSFHFTATFGLHEDKALAPRAGENCEFSGLSALVLDDNAACRRALGAMLKRWKVKADLVESSAAAWKLLEKASKAVEPYDIVLLDEDLPDTDSIVLAQRMGEKEGLFGALVVLLGSADEPQEAAHWRDLGAAACITKPVKESELFQALAESIAAVPAASV